MKNLLKITGVVFLVSLFMIGCSRYNTIQNVEYSKLHVSKDISEMQMYTAIKKAAMNEGWTISKIDDGHAVATMDKQAKKVMVDIIYTRDYYSIYYKGSKGLSVDTTKNTIDKDYNIWVDALKGQIENQISMM